MAGLYIGYGIVKYFMVTVVVYNFPSPSDPDGCVALNHPSIREHELCAALVEVVLGRQRSVIARFDKEQNQDASEVSKMWFTLMLRMLFLFYQFLCPNQCLTITESLCTCLLEACHGQNTACAPPTHQTSTIPVSRWSHPRLLTTHLTALRHLLPMYQYNPRALEATLDAV